MNFKKRSAAGTPPAGTPEDGGKKPVLIYILVLFLAAFLLMAASFLAHRRSDTGGLRDNVSVQEPAQPGHGQALSAAGSL